VDSEELASARWTCCVAVVAAAAAGVGELLVISAQCFALDRFVMVGEQIIWMAPLANTLLFFPLAVLILVLRRFIRPLRTQRLQLWIFLTLVLLATAFHNERIHGFASLVLSAGLAYQISRVLCSSRRIAGQIMPYAAIPMVALVTLAAVTVNGAIQMRQQQQLAALPPSSQDAPNVVLVVMDTVRAASTSLHGYHRATTPRQQQLAAEGAWFKNAISTSCWTLPAHASFFTGRFPVEFSANWRDRLDTRHPVLAEQLAARGYRCGGFIANFFYCNREMGLARGFHHYQDYAICGGELLYASSILRWIANSAVTRHIVGHRYSLGYQDSEAIVKASLQWIDRGSSGPRRPFFAFLNLLDAHHPYFPPEPFAARFAGAGTRPDPDRWWFGGRFCHNHELESIGAHELKAHVDAYDGAVAYVDHWVGELAQALQQRGLLENTVLIITSDHGESFGENRRFNHGTSLYLQQTHVPLIIRFPRRVRAGTVIEPPITLRDLAATILDLTGGAPTLPGRSLAATWGDPVPTSDPSPLLAQYHSKSLWEQRKPSLNSAMHVGPHRLFRLHDHSTQLYDLHADPGETTDLARQPEKVGILRALNSRLDDVLTALGAR
jgi:arylsulfatase A-like enzyme